MAAVSAKRSIPNQNSKSLKTPKAFVTLCASSTRSKSHFHLLPIQAYGETSIVSVSNREIFVTFFCLFSTKLLFSNQSAESKVLNIESALHNELCL